MTDYQIIMDITNANDGEALAALEWLKNTYGNDVKQIIFRSVDTFISGEITATTFNDSVSVIQNLKSQFTDRLVKYDLQVSESL